MTHLAMHQHLRAILVILLTAVTMSGCGKADESKKIEPSQLNDSPPTISQSFDPHKFISQNADKWNKFSVPLEAFIRTAQRDFTQAIYEYGSEDMRRKTLNIGKHATTMFQASMGSIVIGLSNVAGERPAVMFYHPFTDLLILTRWTWDGKIVESYFMTGNYFLGDDEPISIPFFTEFREERNQLGRVVLITSRVRKKFWEVYPGRASEPIAEVRDMPQEALTQKVLFLAKMLEEEKNWETQANSDLLKVFQDSWIKGDLKALQEVMCKDSHLNAENLVQLPPKYRDMVVVNSFEPPGKPRHVLIAHPELHSTWYYLVVGVDGKVFVNALTDLTISTADLK